MHVARASPSAVGREYYPENPVSNQASPSCYSSYREGLHVAPQASRGKPKNHTVLLAERKVRTLKPLAFGE